MLKFLSRVKIEFNAVDPRTASCMEFLAQCNSRKAKESNPACEVEVKRVNVEHPPQVTVTFVNGGVEAFHATSTPAHNITDMILKKSQLLETEQMFREAGEQWPVIIPEEEISQYEPGTKELSVSSTLTKADNLDPLSPKDPSCTKTKGDIGVKNSSKPSRPKRTLVPAMSMLSKDLSTFDLFDESEKLKPRSYVSSFSHCMYGSTTIASALNRHVFMPCLPSLSPAIRVGGIRCRWHLQGVNYGRWLVILDKVGVEGASIEEIINCYVQTLAKVVGSVEQAKKKICNVCCKKKFAFGCVIDEEEAEELRKLPDIMFVLPVPNTYDFDHKDLGWGNYEMAALFPGCDYKHWLILMVNPAGKGVSDQEMVDGYIQILAKVLGNVEDAKKKIYSVCCQRKVAFFGCQVEKETAKKLEKLPEVLRIYLDSYADPVNKDYGAQLVVNGQIVKRSIERQRLVGTEYAFHFVKD